MNIFQKLLHAFNLSYNFIDMFYFKSLNYLCHIKLSKNYKRYHDHIEQCIYCNRFSCARIYIQY